MASKQLGKLKQWAGEVMSREKATVLDEFRELEEDIDLRRHGVKRLLAASNAYHHILSKKRQFSVFLDDPAGYLPIEALGMVMVLHGEEFPEDSAFGSSLVKFGRAHCKIATLQEAYAVSLRSTFISSMESLLDDMKNCKLQRKKLESRRLSYDATISKAEKLKSSKKEKERKDAEDESQQAKLRYEEMAEDVRSRMIEIQDNEISQLRELTTFLDLELHFATQYLEVLKNAKAEWCNDPVVKNREISESSKRGEAMSDMSSSEEEVESKSPATSSRRSSFNCPGSRSISKESSKPHTGSSRKRSASANNSGGEKEKEKNEKSGGRRLTVAGWASSAVGSVTKKSKDTFAALTGGGVGDRLSDGEGEEPITQSFSSSYVRKSPKSKSKDSIGNVSPKVAGKILKPPALQSRRLVRATHDFNGSSEELSFKTGDEIVVVSEVLDEWWMGELDGRKGLFPTVYTEVVDINSDHRGPRTPLEKSDELSSSSEGSDSSDLDGERLCMAHPVALARGVPYLDHLDIASITNNPAEEKQPPIPVIPPSLTRAHSANSAVTKRPDASENVMKRPPPPPPPRRSTSNGPISTPPLPERKPNSFRPTLSPATAALPSLMSSSSTSSPNYEVSPFESSNELTTEAGCQSFQQHPFKLPGMCSNCFTMHS